jgi:hypothetical protein
MFLHMGFSFQGAEMAQRFVKGFVSGIAGGSRSAQGRGRRLHFDGTPIRVCFTGMKRRTHWELTILLALLLLAVAGCSKSKTPEASTATPPPNASANQTAAKEDPTSAIDACTLLTKEEAAAVQGEPFKATKGDRKSGAGLTVSQCYFELPTTVNSIVLTVTQKTDGPGGRDPSQSWQEIFHREKERKKEGEEAEPQKIEGIGDEAFWTGTRVGGALYVLKGNCYIRISVGGAGDQAQKIEKSKALAESVLKRL